MLRKTYHDPGYWERELPAWNDDDAGCFPDYQPVMRRQQGTDYRMVLRPTDGDRIRCLSSSSCLVVSDRHFQSYESSSIASYPQMRTWPYNSCHCTSMYRDKRSLVPNRKREKACEQRTWWWWLTLSSESGVVSATKAKKAFQEKTREKRNCFPERTGIINGRIAA